MPWPKGSPDFPNGAQVQAYLSAYVKRFGLDKLLQLRTEVVTATQEPDKRWRLTLRSTDVKGKRQPGAKTSERTFDRLVVCNGVFSDGSMPDYQGVEAYAKSGGILSHSSAFTRLEDARNKDVIIVGYGKSAIDVAVAVSEVSKSTTVVARQLIWKLPRHLNGVLPYQYLLLTRVGEALFLFRKPGPVSRLLHGPLIFVRKAMLGSLAWVVRRQLHLEEVGLLPTTEFETIARSQISLVSEGFFEAVREGKIMVKRDTSIVKLDADLDKKLVAYLSDGTALPADIVLTGTGFHQRLPFMDAKVVRQFTDARGNFLLYRSIQPLEIKNLYFNGYNSSLFCPTSAEVAALWIGSALSDDMPLPPVAERRQEAQEVLDWLDARSSGKHARGTCFVPHSLANIDTLTHDLKIGLPWYSKLYEWLLPVKPAAYTAIADQVIKRIQSKRKAL